MRRVRIILFLCEATLPGCIYIYSVQNFKGRWWQALIALFFVYMARPHIGLSLLAGSGIAILLGSEIKPALKVALSSVALIGAVYLSSSTLESLRIEDFSLETLEEFTGTKVNDLSKGNHV